MARISFEPLKIRRLSELIEDSIKDLVLSGQLKPGEKLPTEPQISRQFGVSIVTVREALRGLEAFGIIRKKRGKGGGIFISQIDSDMVKSSIHGFLTFKKFSAKDLGDARLIIEPAVVAIAALNITEDELKGLENNIKYCENRLISKRHAFSTRDFFIIEERNVEFHRLLAEATHNPLLFLTVDYMMDFLMSFKKTNLTPDIEFSIRIVKDHRDILNDLSKGDSQAAKQHLIEHLNLVEEYLTSKEQQSSEPTNKKQKEK